MLPHLPGEVENALSPELRFGCWTAKQASDVYDTFSSDSSLSDLAAQTNHLGSFEEKLNDRMPQRLTESKSLEMGSRHLHIDFNLYQVSNTQ